MLAEYSAMVAVPAFMYAGADAAHAASRHEGLAFEPSQPAGNITLGGVPADVRQLIKNAAIQMAVQAVVDLVRPHALARGLLARWPAGAADALPQHTPTPPLSWPSRMTCSITTSTIWCVPFVTPRRAILTPVPLACASMSGPPAGTRRF